MNDVGYLDKVNPCLYLDPANESFCGLRDLLPARMLKLTEIYLRSFYELWMDNSTRVRFMMFFSKEKFTFFKTSRTSDRTNIYISYLTNSN